MSSEATAEEVVHDHGNPPRPENGRIVQRVDRVSDLRALCIHNDTGSLSELTKPIPHVTHAVAAL